MMFPLVRDLAAEGIPVRLTCRVLGFSPQAFSKWRAKPCSERDWSDAWVVNAIVDVHGDDPEFGYRFIADELERAGHHLGEDRVHRLCRENRVCPRRTPSGLTDKQRGRPTETGDRDPLPDVNGRPTHGAQATALSSFSRSRSPCGREHAGK
jgi:putative transposase